MTKKILITLLIIIVAATGMYLTYSFGKKSALRELQSNPPPQTSSPQASQTSSAQSQQAEREQAEQGIPVKVGTVRQEDIHLAQTFYGTAVPYSEANVQGEQGGKITLLKGEEGDTVNEGELIVQFDDSDTQLELKRAISSKNTAAQMVKQAQSNLDTIQADVKRNEELLKDGFVSKQQFDGLNNQLQVARASLNTSYESVKQADAQISLLNNVLADLKITAPISGIIDEKRYNLHEVYRAGDIIYHIVDINKIYVEVEVPETYISELREKMNVNVFFDPLEGREFSGVIDRIIPKGDPQSRNFLAKALVENADNQIKPGMFSRVSVEIQSIPGAFVMDKKALVKDGERYYVFKVVDSQVKKVIVDVQLMEGETAAVVSDELQAGDQVVTEGTHLLKPDARIKTL